MTIRRNFVATKPKHQSLACTESDYHEISINNLNNDSDEK